MNKIKKQTNRRMRIRKKINAVTSLPRLSVFRSNKYISAQIIDDLNQKTIVAITESANLSGTKVERAKQVGEQLARKAKEKKVTTVVFDKGSYAYHGRVRAFAEGAREGGLNF